VYGKTPALGGIQRLQTKSGCGKVKKGGNRGVLVRWLTAAIVRAKSLINKEIIMAYVIGDGCINCAACESACPAGAISEKGDARVIDAGACLDCGACAGECPAGIISQG
jgi:ferredoxin